MYFHHIIKFPAPAFLCALDVGDAEGELPNFPSSDFLRCSGDSVFVYS